MKLNAFNLGMPRLWLPPKILLIMRLIIIMMTTFLLQVSASSIAQKLTYVKQGATLNQVFQEIKKQTGFKVVYSNRAVDGNIKLNADFKNEDINGVMELLLKDKPLTFELDEKNIIIKVKEPSFLEKVVGVFEDINVSGRVVDADGRGLPGASVTVKGKGGKAVSTGANGSFYLKGVNESAVLVVSFIGYVSKEVKAARELGDVMLEVSLSKLDEVQVIAYGTTTQRLSTGNVTTIKADVIEKQPVNNPLLALQGRVPGLFIEQATGFAGTGVKVRIQGQNSKNAGSDPLYVLDGVPFTSQLLPGGNTILGNSGTNNFSNDLGPGNPLSFINPSDIESIDILKDADATAIYGSRAANGAILITTKKGKSGDTRISLNLQSGWSKVPRKLDLMNSEQYLAMRTEALKNDGISDPAPGPFGDSDLNGNWDNTRYTDWQKVLMGKTAGYQDLNASISGGNNNTTFSIGTGYHRETNVFPDDYADQKGSVKFNINNSSNNQRFKVQFSGFYLIDNNQLPNRDLTGTAIGMAPVSPELYNSDGSINWEPDALGNTTFFNPIGQLNDKFLAKTSNLLGNMIVSYEILKGLELKSSFGYSNTSANTTSKSYLESTQPEYLQYISRSTVFGNSKMNSWTIEPQLSYRKNISKGQLDLLLGTTILQNRSDGSSITAFGFSNDLVMDDIMSAPTLLPGSSINSLYKYNAVFGRLNYNWLDKYILNLSGRRDGSSRFGPESQFHNFAAAGAAWIFSNENLIKDNWSFLSYGKLKASYGTTGSDQIGNYIFLALYSPYKQGIPYQGIPIYRPNGLINPYLQWEETKKLSLAIDLGLLKDRITVNATYYRNHSSNQLAQYQLPTTTGSGAITQNQAYKIRNAGWEMTLSSTNLSIGAFTWLSNVNLTIPKTLLVDYPEIEKSSAASTAIIGAPLSIVRLYHFLGVDPVKGIYQFADKSGNPTTTPKFEDLTVVLDQAPKFYGGFQNTLNYKGFQLDILLSYVKQIGQNYSFGTPAAAAGMFRGGFLNQPIPLLNRWQKSGDIASIQKLTTGYDLQQSIDYVYTSDAAWSDASYLRLKNVSLSWSLSNDWARRVRLSSCSLFVQGQNLLTWTKYTGLDPETKSSTTLPPLRTITVGIKAAL